MEDAADVGLAASALPAARAPAAGGCSPAHLHPLAPAHPCPQEATAAPSSVKLSPTALNREPTRPHGGSHSPWLQHGHLQSPDRIVKLQSKCMDNASTPHGVHQFLPNHASVSCCSDQSPRRQAYVSKGACTTTHLSLARWAEAAIVWLHPYKNPL